MSILDLSLKEVIGVATNPDVFPLLPKYLTWLHTASNFLIAIANYAISFAVVYFVRYRSNYQMHRILLLFGAFTAAAGTKNLMEIWTLWDPGNPLAGYLYIFTVAGYAIAASTLVSHIPQALTLPSWQWLNLLTREVLRQLNELRQAEDALKESEERFRSTFEQAAVGISHVSLGGTFLRLNQRFCDIAGYPQAELQNLTFQEITHPDDLTSDLAYVSSLLADEIETYSMEKRYIRKDRSLVWINLTVSLVRDGENKHKYFIAVIEDITDRKQAETVKLQAKRLSLELQLLEQILEVTLAGYWDWNLVTDREYLSPTFKQMFGYEDHELPNTPETWQNLIFAEDLPGVMERFNQHVQSQGKVPFYNEVRYKHKNGSTIWVICSGRVIEWNEDGAPLRMVGCHIDITERKQVEEQLQTLSARLTLALKSAAIGTWEWDMEHTVLWDRRMYELLGLQELNRPAEYEDWANVLYPEDREMVAQALQQAVNGEKDFDTEFRAIHPDGSVHFIRTSGIIQRDEQGQPQRMVGINYDITEQKAVETALKKNEERLQLAFEGSGDGLWDWNITTGELYLSDRWLGMLGYNREDLPLTIDTWGTLIHSEEKPRVLEALNAHLEDSSNRYAFDYRVLTKAGEWKWVSNYGKVVMRDEQGKPLRMTGIHRDISDRKLTEKLQALLKEKELMMMEIHHRVKNNLQIIYSLLRLQQRRLKDNSASEILLESQNRIRSIALIHEKIYRSEDFSSINFSEYVSELVSELFRSYRMSSNSATFKIQVEPVVVEIDKAILCGLLINELVTNSLKYAFPDAHKGNLQVDFFKEQSQDNFTLIIQDNGVGIPKDFDFTQSASIGLQLVHDLTQQLSGDIQMNCDRGTAFTITFPVAA